MTTIATTKLFDSTIDWIESEEGFSSTVYDDGLGFGTIGFGSRYPEEYNSRTITVAKAELVMIDGLKTEYLPALDKELRRVKWDVPQASRQALGSFLYNLGSGAFTATKGFETLQRTFAAKSKTGVADALLLYYNPGTPVAKGLLDRRRRERDMWLKGWVIDPWAYFMPGERKKGKRLEELRANARKRGSWLEGERVDAQEIKEFFLRLIGQLKKMSDKELGEKNRRQRLALSRDLVARRKLSL